MDVDVSQYFVRKRGGGDFTPAFYNLGLIQKRVLLAVMEAQGLLDSDAVKHKVANALLQHWPTNRGEEYPVTGINRLPKAARDADLEYGI